MKVVPVLPIFSTFIIETLATCVRSVFNTVLVVASYRCSKVKVAFCVMLVLLLATSKHSQAETPAGSTLTKQQRHSVQSLLKQVELTYRFEQFEREARVRAIEQVVRAWSQSTQSKEDTQKLQAWLSEAKKKTVPGLAAPLPKRPFFSHRNKKRQTTSAQPSSVKKPQAKPSAVVQTKPIAAHPIEGSKLSRTTRPKLRAYPKTTKALISGLDILKNQSVLGRAVKSLHVVKKPISDSPSELLKKTTPLSQSNEPAKITTSEKIRTQIKLSPLPSSVAHESKVVIPTIAEDIRKNAGILPASQKPLAELPTRKAAAQPKRLSASNNLRVANSETKLSAAFAKRFPSANQLPSNQSRPTDTSTTAHGVGQIDYKELAAQVDGYQQGVRQLEAQLVTKKLLSIEQLQTISNDLTDLQAQREILAIYLQAVGRSQAEIANLLPVTFAKSMLLRAVNKRKKNWEATRDSRRVREHQHGLEVLRDIARKQSTVQSTLGDFTTSQKQGKSTSNKNVENAP